MKGVTTLVMLVTLVFAGIAGFYFLEHQHRSDNLAASMDNIAQLQDEIRDYEGQVARLQADLEKTTKAAQEFKAEALRWHDEAAGAAEARAKLERQIRDLGGQLAAARKPAAVPESPAAAPAEALPGLDAALRGAAEAGRLALRKESAAHFVVTVPSHNLFGPGPADLKGEGRAILREIAQAVTNAAAPPIRVEAHTDDVPIGPKFSKQYPTNLELAKARAAAVAAALAEDAGLPAGRVAAAGIGEARPVAPNDTPEGRARNSRVEIHLGQ